MVFTSIPLAVIGFKKQNKVLAALSLLLITGSYGLAEVYSKKKGIPKEGQAIVAGDGESLYKANCVVCHGNDGKLGASGAKDLSISTLDVASIKEMILHGKGSMPAAQVSEEQAGLIADYVQSQIIKVTPNTMTPNKPIFLLLEQRLNKIHKYVIFRWEKKEQQLEHPNANKHKSRRTSMAGSNFYYK